MSTKSIHKAAYIAVYLGALVMLAPQVFASPHAEGKLSDKAICEKLGEIAFNKSDYSHYIDLNSELDDRRDHNRFTINPRACELYGLARAVNAKKTSEEQVETAVEGTNALIGIFEYELKELRQAPASY